MADKPRRQFLKASAGLVPGLAMVSCADEQRGRDGRAAGLDRSALESVGWIVLPGTALGDNGVRRVVAEFLAWLDEFEPVSERDHPYESGEILYGPPDPAPLWRAQIEALDIESGKRFSAPFAEIDAALQREILVRQLPENLPTDMPFAGAATHVAIGLLSWFYATAEANDLALEAKVGRMTCRGLAGVSVKPGPLES